MRSNRDLRSDNQKFRNELINIYSKLKKDNSDSEL
jgi:hypothetical protein